MATTTAWPDATNTGVPAGTALTAYNGNLVISTPGAVVSGLDIHGTVTITAPNVTLVNCQVTSPSFYIIDCQSTGAVVQNCTINGVGTGNDGDIAINGSGTFLNNNIFNVENGIAPGDNSVIQSNYIHGLQASGSPHYDAIQIDGAVSNVTISHNSIINDHNQTSAIMIDNWAGAVSNVSVDNNILVGGGYTVYDDAHFNGGSITGVSFTNNHMGSGGFGLTDFNGTNPVYSGNVNDGATLAAELNTSANSGGTTTSPVPNAPVIASFSPDSGVVGDGITNANTLDLKGTADPNSTITVYDGSAKLGTVKASSTGSWDYITSVLTDAKHMLTATETNSSGQTSAASAALAVTVDTKAPAAPVLASDSVVNTNHVQLSGTAEANSTVTVYDGTTVVGTGTTNSAGTWSVTTGALSSGAHALTATATDNAGNVSAASQPLDPVIPSVSTPPPTPPTAPKIVSFSPDTGVVGDHITSDNTPTLTGTAVANSTVNVFDGTTQIGTATANANGQWTLTTKALSDGTHNLTTTDTDSSGHTSVASSAFAVTIDTHAPNAPTLAAYSQGGSAVGHTTALNDLILKGAAEANSTIDIFDSGKQIGVATASSSGNWSYDTGHLGDGSHSFTAKAVDVAGNVGAASAADAVTVTTSTTPTPTGHNPIEFTNVAQHWDGTATITGTADAYSQIKIYDGTTSLGTVTTNAKGAWSFTTSSLPDTLHTFKAQELDHSGHVVETSSGAAILAGSDTSTFMGTGGDDFMYSSSSKVGDTFVFASDFGHSTIQGFTPAGPGQDTIQLSKSVFDSFASVLSHASQVGQDVVISTGNQSLTLKDMKLSALNSHDFHFA